MPHTLPADGLQATVTRILEAAGSQPAEAQQVAANLVLANLSGHDSHGVGMLPRYVDAVAEGGLKPNTGVRVNLDIGTMMGLDGQHGYGQVVGAQAMELGIARAKQHGSCIFTLANAHHLGRIGHFAEMATAQGLVSMHFVNVLSRPVVAPWGGGDGRFGTNPCCIGIPLAGAEPFVLDYATSRVAQGKMRVAHNKGESVPDGYLIDAQGAPTNDPGVVVVPQSNGLFGALMTFGEHKGYGMAVVCELLGGALTGGGTWHRPADTSRTILNGMLTVLIDPQRLGTQASFDSEAHAFIDWLRQSPKGQGFDEVQIAGEPERKARAARQRDGIWVDDATWGEIVAAGAKVGVLVTD
ncbi:malate/lactate/ureidoglycolate dehydrogenase [Variovorax sp. GB1P17]|uniref:malate/lactate/ureidoglycolate dehydrogenase n=1 Tax=Variovorax sp. GB1P17 TaxID=3443740 RepID=UPI003F458350